MTTTPIQSLANFIKPARRILVFTGAGISTASGIPDYRGPQGVWKTRQPVYYHDFMRSEPARIEYWDYKLEYWPTFQRAAPNANHAAIVRLEQAGRLGAVVTQNIDGLHARAGTSPARLVELHGTGAWVECQACGERTEPGPHFELFARTRKPPLCHCGGYLKPATISFGQNLRPDDLDRAEAAACEADLVLALGSTLSVQPAAQIPLLAARRGAPYAVVNRGPTDHDQQPEVSLRLDGAIEEIFPPAIDLVLNQP